MLVLTALFSVGCIFPTSSSTIEGRVRDYKKQAVADAEVKFGGTGFQTVTKTLQDGSFTITVRHRPTQMLNLTVSKPRIGTYSDKFPGFAAPGGDIDVELINEISTIPLTE